MRRIFWVGVLGVVFTLNGYVAMGQLVSTDPTPPRPLRGGTFEPEPENYRTIYFTGTAVSNAHIDANPFSNCLQQPDRTWRCQLPKLKCRLSIINLSPENISQIVQVSFNHQILTQQLIPDRNSAQPKIPDTSDNFSGIDPFLDPFKSRPDAINTFRIYPNTEKAAWLGTMERNAPLQNQPGDAPQYTLAPNQVLIIEQGITINYDHQISTRPTSTGTWAFLNLSGLSPYLKAPIFCSGRISVKDAAPNQSGYIVAQGALDYFANSYLPTAYELPAVPNPTIQQPPSTLTMTLRQNPYTNASCRIAQIPEQIQFRSELTNSFRVTTEAGAIADVPFTNFFEPTRQLYSPLDGTLSGPISRLHTADNIRVSSVPISINGGSPF